MASKLEFDQFHSQVLALIIAVFEFVWKRRKILVDGNVRIKSK